MLNANGSSTPDKSEVILSLKIADLPIVLKSPEPSSDDKKVKDNPQQITFHVHRGFIPKIGNKEKVFDSGSAWSLFRSGSRYFLQDDNLASHLIPETLIMFARDLQGGDIFLRDPDYNESLYTDLFGHPVNQILLILLLSSRKGIVVHACGIEDDGRGYLFAGNSTNGKSTLAKLWHDRGATVLNDDRIIIRERDGVFWMYGTPWHGTFEVTSQKALPVDKIFLLRHGKENLLIPKTGSEAISMLLTRSFPTFWDRAGMEQALGLMDRMTGALPCYELHFLPDGEVIDFIRGLDQ